MHLHLAPKIYAPNVSVAPQLVDVRIPEIDLYLEAGLQLRTSKPYPNKGYIVASKKEERSASNGLVVQTPEFLSEFSVITRWCAYSNLTLTHVVQYEIIDDEFDAVTDLHTAYNYHKRWSYYDAPVATQPRMDLLTNNKKHQRGKANCIEDEYSFDGVLVKRTEKQRIHTIKFSDLMSHELNQRFPNTAFVSK